MRHLLPPVVLVAATLSACAESSGAPWPSVSASDEDQKVVAQGANALVLPLLRDLAGEGAGKNACCSPLSAHGALMLAWEGARGKTAEELGAALGLPAEWDHARAHAACGALQRGLVQASSAKVRLANAAWGRKGMSWEPAAKEMLAKHYAAPFMEADFKGDPAGEARRINAWAGAQTAGKIKQVLGEQEARELRLVLANALYFKGDWQEPFKKSGTATETFTQAGGLQVQAPLMHRGCEDAAYAETDTEQVLELPYKEEEFGMVVVLPRKADGLPDLLAKADAKVLAGWVAALKHEPRVIVALPKWKVEQQHDLIPSLSALGVEDLFSVERADLHGFAKTMPEGNLYVDMVRQDVFCEVDETGTEAAAVTVAEVKCEEAPQASAVFRADHPFLYFVRERKSGVILFAGVMAKPEAAK